MDRLMPLTLALHPEGWELTCHPLPTFAYFSCAAILPGPSSLSCKLGSRGHSGCSFQHENQGVWLPCLGSSHVSLLPIEHEPRAQCSRSFLPFNVNILSSLFMHSSISLPYSSARCFPVWLHTLSFCISQPPFLSFNLRLPLSPCSMWGKRSELISRFENPLVCKLKTTPTSP